MNKYNFIHFKVGKERDPKFVKFYKDYYVDYIEKHGKLRGAHVLDIGSGDGRLAFFLHKYVEKWYGLESSKMMLKRARKNRTELNIENKIRFHESDMHKTPFSKDKFDIIIYSNSLHFSENPKRAFQEAYRILKDGGLLFVFEHPSYLRWGSNTLNKTLEDGSENPDFNEKFCNVKLGKLASLEKYLNNQKLFTKLNREGYHNRWVFRKAVFSLNEDF
jgi:ubiquinone/menaquinone biosynthesis C-methylase UbiE